MKKDTTMMRDALTKIFLGLLVLLALASCSSEDKGTEPDVVAPIDFGATEENLSTRASSTYYATASTGIPLAQSMGVFGYQYPAKEDWAEADTANFMYNRRMVSKGRNDDGHTEFYYSPLSFWPQADTYRLAFLPIILTLRHRPTRALSLPWRPVPAWGPLPSPRRTRAVSRSTS